MPPELSSGDGRKDCLHEKKNDRDRWGTEKISFSRGTGRVGRARGDSSTVIEGAAGLETPHSADTAISSKHSSSGLSWPHAASRRERHSFFFEDASYRSTLSPLTDVPVQEKIYEDENLDFHVEGRYSKNSRELMESSLGSRYFNTDQKLQHWDTRDKSLFPIGRRDILNGKSVDHISLHSSHLHSDSESLWDQVQSKEQSRKTGVEDSSMDHTIDADRRPSGNDIGRSSDNDFETRFDRYGSLSTYSSHVGETHNHLEDYLGSSVEWKPLKWVRSGNLSSCSSIFGRSGSFKEPRGEMHNHHDVHGKLSAHHSTSRLSESGIYVVPDDETHLQKKQRLGWGQGLAKYEKQKVEGHDDETNKSDLTQCEIKGDFTQCEISLSPKVEEMGCTLQTNLYTRSPKVTRSSGCGSPATTYSVICISSPDERVSSSVACSNEVFIEEKSCIKASDVICPEVNVADVNSDLQSALPISGSDSILGESYLESEHLELNPVMVIRSMSIDTLQAEDTTLGISGSASVAAAKLLSSKIDLLQKLEKIECDIEKYEKELKLLYLETKTEDHHFLRTNYLEADGDCSLEACAEASDKGLGDRCSNALDGGLQPSSTMPVFNDGFTAPVLNSKANEVSQTCLSSELQSTEFHVLISEDNTTDTKVVRSQWSEEPLLDIPSIEYQLVRTEDRLAEALAVRSQSSGGLEHNVDKLVTVSTCNGPLESQLISSEEPRTAACIEVNKEVACQSMRMAESRDLVSSILAANKEVAKEALELVGKLLPTVLSGTSGVLFSDILDSSVWKQNAVFDEINRKQMEAKITDRRHFMNFKERALALKFRAYRQLWKDDQHLTPTRRHQARTQKRCETNYILSGGHKRHQSSVRSRFAYPAANLASAPTKEAIRLASKLLSNAKDKPYRSILKMPALALNEGEKCSSRFITRNGLVGDPISFEKERTMVNPWMPEEKGIFLEKFAAFGKNFSKIASFLEHKTTADCVEFYYKNQKSEDFMKIKKMHKLHNEREKFCASTYLTTSGNSQHREPNAASLDVFKAASNQAVGIWHTLQKYAGRPLMGIRFDHERCTSQSFMDTSNKRIINSGLDSESTAAVDVLAGICGAFCCEAVGSCITTTGVDRSESFKEKGFSSQHKKKNADTEHILTSEDVENIEIHYSSEEICEEINVDWTDDERALFISAVAMFGKDFGRISHYVHTRTEDQCKTFFSKARKRLGLDELIPQESDISAKRNHGRDDDETGLDKICALLWDTDTSAKVGKIPYSNTFNEAGPNSKVGIVLDDFCKDHHRSEVGDNQKKSNGGDGKTSLKEETELKESADALQNATEMTSGRAAASPETQHFLFNRSSMNSGGLHVCSVADTQQNKDNPNILDADAFCPDKSIKSPIIVESYDKPREFVGNSIEGEDHKPCEAVISCSGKKSFINDLERYHAMVKRKEFIDGRAESKKYEDAGSLMEPISSEEDSRFPGNVMMEKHPVNMTNQGSRSAGTVKLPTSVPNENSLYHCSSLNSEILKSDSLVNATTDRSRAAVLASDDVTNKEKCLIGSRLTDFGNDPFGMNVKSATINSKSLVGGKSSSASSTNNVAWDMDLDGKESIPLPVHGQENMPICTSVVSQFNQKPSDSFSCFPQQKIHYMRPEVVHQQNQHISSLVVPKGHKIFQQGSASSALVRKQHLDSPMVHHYQIEEECHKIQQQGSSDSELPSQQFRGPLQMLNQTEVHIRNVDAYQQETLPLDFEQSSSWKFGGHQLQMLNHIQAYARRNVDAYKQEALQQTASEFKLSSRVLAGQQLQVISQEEICREKEKVTYQRAQLQHLAWEHYNSQVKSLQHNHIIQPNSQQHMIQKVQNAKEEHQSPASQLLQMSNSEQIQELSNHIKQSSQIPSQYQHLHQWQQKRKAYNDICEDYMFPKKTKWQVESHEHLQSRLFENNFDPIIKSIYSAQVSSSPGETEIKSCPEPEAQTPRRGDIKLFGQNLLSHPSNASKFPPSNKDITESTESLQGSHKPFSLQENDEWCLAVATMPSEKQSQTHHSCVHSEDIAASAENTKSGRVQEAVAHMIEHFAREAQESKQNLAKVGAGYLGQDFGGQNLQFWEGSEGRNLCNNSMPVQTDTLPLPQDLNLQFKGHYLVGTSVDQPVKAGRFKERSLNSSAIAGVHGRVIQDVLYPMRDPLTIRHSDYHPAGHRNSGSSSFPSLDLKLPECSVEFQKRNCVLDMATLSGKPGRCDTVQSMFAFQPQIRNVFRDTDFQMGGVMPGGTVSDEDPVSAIKMPDPAAEQVSLNYPHLTNTRDLESERGDYNR